MLKIRRRHFSPLITHTKTIHNMAIMALGVLRGTMSDKNGEEPHRIKIKHGT